MTQGRRIILTSFVVENTLKPNKFKGMTKSVYLRGSDWHQRALTFPSWSLCLATALIWNIYFMPTSDTLHLRHTLEIFQHLEPSRNLSIVLSKQQRPESYFDFTFKYLPFLLVLFCKSEGKVVEPSLTQPTLCKACS